MFEHAETFQEGEVSGNLRLGKLEALYQELFVEVIADGLITTDERTQLDNMADSLGLDRQRLRKLEDALEAAYGAQHHIADHVAIDIDVSDLAAPPTEVDITSPFAAALPHEPHELVRALQRDPRDEASLHQLFRVYQEQGETDRAWCVAHVLAYTSAADAGERACFDAHRTDVLIRPKQPLDPDAWQNLLVHPDEDAGVGDIFGVVAPAVLLGRLSALRRDDQLPALDAARRQDPKLSTVQAVRCFSWAAAIFGMTSPELHVDPDHPAIVEFVPAIPPVALLGAHALSDRSSEELAFLAGEQLTYFRDVHFVSLLTPSIANLEQIFLAALCIGKPDLPLAGDVRARVAPIAHALEPMLEPAAVDRLRSCVVRFVERGGRTNLQRWAEATRKTAARAGLLLSNDLRTAHDVSSLQNPGADGAGRVQERMDDLLRFATSDSYAELRQRIGIAVS